MLPQRLKLSSLCCYLHQQVPAAVPTQSAGLLDLQWDPPCTRLRGQDDLLGSLTHNGVM